MKKLLLPLLTLFIVACNDLDDNLITYTTSASTEDFIWKGMNYWYYWQEDVEDLADDRFADNEEYTSFLTSFANPESLFYNLCNDHSVLFGETAATDRFSYITSDYNELVNSLGGEFVTNGVEYGLAQFSDNEEVFGYVKYIMPNSNASAENIHRGDLFTHVDGIQLTLNNYNDLLASTTYTLGMASITDPNLVTNINPPSTAMSLNGTEITLTQTSYEENPLLITDVIETGNTNVGYLMYNGFTSTYDTQLNNAFSSFQNANISDLVIDLRYNGGGSVNTARILSSLIAGQLNGQLFIKQRWNAKVQPQLSDNQLNRYFTNTNSDGASLNSVQLNTVYILTTRSTASASELIINALDPYINVVQIGTTTRGKNEFSITLVDDPGNSYVYNSNREGFINPENSYAMQPLVGRNENSVGFLDYTEGFTPETILAEDLNNMGILGDINEPLLAEALSQISGTGRYQQHPQLPVIEFTNNKRNIKSFNTAIVEDIPTHITF